MRRLSLSLLLLVVIAVIGVGWAIDQLFARFDPSENNNLALARQLGNALAMTVEGSSDTAAITDRWHAVTAGNLQLISRSELPLPEELQLMLDSGKPITLESTQGVTLYFAVPQTGQVLLLAVPNLNAGATRMRLLFTVLFYTAIMLLMLLWLYPLIARLQRLAATAKAFGEGELHQRIPTHRHSNLYDIETEFNHMARRIEGLVEDNKLLSSAVSHDLRTPLARLRFGIDALSETKNTAVQTDYLERISADLTEMEHLVEVLLEFARLDQQLQDLPLAKADLQPLVERAVTVCEGACNHSVRWQSDNKTLNILAHERYTSMLINNILQNAIQHAHSSIRVTTTETNDRIILEIEDDGKGIAEADRSSILKPFVRGKTSTDQQQSSQRRYGLGLAIVSRIAEWHGAELVIGESKQLGGAKIGVGFRKS
ncbi:MAG: ATP-binding protein [Granulosicoccus sp.]